MTEIAVREPGGQLRYVVLGGKADLAAAPLAEKKITSRKVVSTQGREMIARVYHFMKSEAENGVYRLTDARWRAAQATGVTERTVSRVLHEERSGCFLEPMAHRRKRASKADVDPQRADFILRVLRDHRAEGDPPLTLAKIKKVLREKIGFNGCLTTLRKLLANVGYRLNQDVEPKKDKAPRKTPPPPRPTLPSPGEECEVEVPITDAVVKREEDPLTREWVSEPRSPGGSFHFVVKKEEPLESETEMG